MIFRNETLTYRSITGGTILGGMVSWTFLGHRLGGAISLAIGSLSCMTPLVNLRHRCGGCGKRPDAASCRRGRSIRCGSGD
ncbi:MAG TPA: hypothetical protein VKU80_12745 [Planctomycetota bacterium]|nr:hypothetical protein [Planctomycetota bacterium]